MNCRKAKPPHPTPTPPHLVCPSSLIRSPAQARKSPDVPYNPQGCWDWWGYTGLDYAVKLAPQLMSIRNMIFRIANMK